MPKFESVTAWIEVEGVALKEFEVDIDEEKRIVRCYVPSESGKEFVLWWSWETDCDSSGLLTVDGQKRSKCMVNHKGAKKTWIKSMSIPGNESLRAKLKFGDIKMTDDESVSLQDEYLIKALGSIELEVYMGTLEPRKSPRPSVKPTSPGAAVPERWQQPIHESMKKAGAHQVVLGEVVPSHESTNIFCPGNKEPIRFVFLYRSQEILIAQEIMPPIPRVLNSPRNDSESPTEDHAFTKEEEKEEDPVEEHDDERRLRALEEQAAAIAQQAAVIAKEAAAMKERMEKRKLERRDGHAKKRPKVEEIDAKAAFRPGEVIDLSDD